jgi:hypothetical protein
LISELFFSTSGAGVIGNPETPVTAVPAPPAEESLQAPSKARQAQAEKRAIRVTTDLHQRQNEGLDNAKRVNIGLLMAHKGADHFTCEVI